MLTRVMVAEHLCMSGATASQFLARHKIDLAVAGLDEIRRIYIESLRAAASGRGSSSEMESERLALLRERRIRAELANREAAGELVRADEVRRGATAAAALTRAHLERIPDTLSARLAVETDPEKINAMMHVEIDAALAGLAASLRSKEFLKAGEHTEVSTCT